MTKEQHAQRIWDAACKETSKNPKLAFMVGFGLHYPLVLDDEAVSISTNGKVITSSPDFLISEYETGGIKLVIADRVHELCHNLVGHCGQRGKAMIKRFGMDLTNRAMDYAINLIIKDMDEDIITDHESFLFNTKYTSMSAWEIALSLEEDMKNGRSNPNPPPVRHCVDGKGGEEAKPQPKSKGEKGDGEGDPNLNAPTSGEVEDKLKEAIADGEIFRDQAEKAQGKEACGDRFNVRAGLTKEIDWRDALEEFKGDVTDHVKHRTYQRMPRRPIHGVIRPGHYNVGLPHIGVVLDTSGSMMDEIPDMLAELEEASAEGFPISIIYCDTAASKVEEFEAGEFFAEDASLQGGGGSDLRPGFDAIAEADIDAIVCLTDLYIKLHPDPPEHTPVLFVLTPCSRELPYSWRDSDLVASVKKLN